MSSTWSSHEQHQMQITRPKQDITGSNNMDDEYMKQLEAQRLAFEAQFGTLESMGFEDKTKNAHSDDDDDNVSQSESEDEKESESASGSDTSFYGFDEIEESDLEEDLPEKKQPVRQPRVVKFQEEQNEYKPSKKEQRLIRSGKAPTVRALETAGQNAAADSDSDSDQERDNLRNDIELQRFLKESHLISAFQTDKDTIHDSELHGKARARTLETRLQSLSQINAVQHKNLESMPMNIRKGMIKKHTGRITKYEQEARDAGTVLSRVSRGEFRRIESTYKNDIERRIGRGKLKKRSGAIRDFGLKVQSVGHSTRNGLKLSAADIAKIKGSK